MGYVVTAGYVTATTAVPGGRAAVDIPQGARLPEDVPDEEIAASLRLGHIVEVVEQVPSSIVADPERVEVPDGSIAEVLAWVDGDPERAAAALVAEEAKGDDARSTLIAALTKIID